MKVIKVQQPKNQVGECSATNAAVAAPLSLRASPATTPAQHSKAGVTFRDILTAVEQGKPLPPEANIIEALVLKWITETVSALAEIFGDSHYLEVGKAIQKLPESDAILDAKISMLPLQLRHVTPLWRTFVRKLPTSVRKLVTKYSPNKRKQEIVKRKILTVTVIPNNRISRSPPSKRRKAQNEDAEGDADSHSDFWFASVKPRVRAPNLRCRGSQVNTCEAAVGSFWLSPLERVTASR